jgi:4-hydroxymandelate oxidase
MIGEYRRHAQALLPADVWRYLEAGAGQELTLRANAAAFSAAPLMPRPLRDVRGGSTRLTLFGQVLEHPILLAPIAYQRLFHRQGECASAVAASAQGGVFVVSSLASRRFEDIAAAGAEGGGVAPWFQLYWQGGREASLRLLRRAEAAGFTAVMLTVDAPVKQATLDLPDGIAAVNLDADVPPARAGGSAVFDGWMAQAPTWDDLAWLRGQTRLPLLVKGILHADDAARAVALGGDGIVVSNHGGRVLDGAPASLAALPAVVERVGGSVPVLLDSGLRSGADAYRALAAGAAAVLVGRPYVWGLAAQGALGVAQVLRLLRDDLEMTMALCGAASLAAIARDATR